MAIFPEFAGSKILVVGGTGGIGSACVKLFVRGGGAVGYTTHKSPALKMKSLGLEAEMKPKHWRVDVADDASLEELARRVESEFRALDAVVMCQGIITGKRMTEYALPEIDRVFNVNVVSMVKLTKLIHPLMAQESSIVYISSISAFAGSYDAVYASTKGAIVSFVKSMARQYGPKIRVNAVAPGLTEDTGMYQGMQEKVQTQHRKATALKRLASPDDIANTVAFLSSRLARQVTGHLCRCQWRRIHAMKTMGVIGAGIFGVGRAGPWTQLQKTTTSPERWLCSPRGRCKVTSFPDQSNPRTFEEYGTDGGRLRPVFTGRPEPTRSLRIP